MTTPSGHCERARRWASLRADGELSELEHALLDAHLERCPGCRAFAAGLDAVETLLRVAPLEELPSPIRVRSLHASRSLRILQASAAVAVFATAGLGAMIVDVFHSASEASTAPRIQRVSAIGNESPGTMRDQRSAFLVSADVRRPTGRVLFP